VSAAAASRPRAAREACPRFVEPMLAQTGTPPPATSASWAWEVKWDGMRAQLRLERDSLCLRSRSGHNFSDGFPELEQLVGRAPADSLLLDGELVCLAADGAPDFSRLRGRLLARTPAAVARAAAATPAKFIAFDLLHLDGEPVRALPYVDRRQLLDALELADDGWQTPRWFGDGAELVEATRAQLLEGVVAKRLDAGYLAGRRSGAWLKQKHRRRERLLITAWLPGDGEPDRFLVARRQSGRLEHAGAVSLGSTAALRQQLHEQLVGRERPQRRRRLRRIEPPLAVDIDHHGRPGGTLRDPLLRGLHPTGR
jgi:bifunctional non-homologous end joining protein LigD